MAFQYFLVNQSVDGGDERHQSLPVPVPEPANAKGNMAPRHLIGRLAHTGGLGFSRFTWYEWRDQLRAGHYPRPRAGLAAAAHPVDDDLAHEKINFDFF